MVAGAASRSVDEATNELAAVLREYATLMSVVRGERAIDRILELNSRVRRSIVEWNTAIYDASGVLPLPEIEDAGDEYEGEDSYEDHAPEEEFLTALTYVSRFDLVVRDAAAAIAFASDLSSPEGGATGGIVGAIDKIAVAHGHPWWSLPGVEVVEGGTAIIEADESIDPSEYAEEFAIVNPPKGRVIWVEGFSGV